jgi:hypothetical protein
MPSEQTDHERSVDDQERQADKGEEKDQVGQAAEEVKGKIPRVAVVPAEFNEVVLEVHGRVAAWLAALSAGRA